MCEPNTFEEGKGKLSDAFDAFMSASSALHMYDDINPDWSDQEEPLAFLDEKYEWGKHCREHITAGMKIMVDLLNAEKLQQMKDFHRECYPCKEE